MLSVPPYEMQLILYFLTRMLAHCRRKLTDVSVCCDQIFNVEATGQYRKLFKLYALPGKADDDDAEITLQKVDIREVRHIFGPMKCIFKVCNEARFLCGVRVTKKKAVLLDERNGGRYEGTGTMSDIYRTEAGRSEHDDDDKDVDVDETCTRNSANAIHSNEMLLRLYTTK